MDTLETLKSYIDCPSISNDEVRFGEMLRGILQADGYRVVSDGLGNLIALDPAAPTRLLFTTHIDTVPPHIPSRVEAERVYGRGACDTKGGIVAMLEAGRRLRSADLQGFGYLFVVREETDHSGAIMVAKNPLLLALDRPQLILCEPTRNRVARAQRGVLKVWLRTQGKAGHSAFPDSGHSAIDPLIAALQALREHDWPTDEVLGEMRFNVGTIQGGVAANVYAPEASAQILFRLNGPAKDCLETVRELARGCEIEVVTQNDPVSYEPPEDLFRDTFVAAFNTDASHLSAVGPVWLVGPGDIEVAHSDHEHIDLSDLHAGITLYEQLGRQVLAKS